MCAQMGPMQMRAYGCLRGGGSLCTSLDMTAINLLGVTHIDSQGLHLSWYCFPCGLRNRQMRASCSDLPPSGLEAIASDYWAIGLAMVAVATLFLLGRSRPTDTDSSGKSHPLEEGHTGLLPLNLSQHTICWRPLASSWLVSALKQSASCFRKFTHHNRCKPWIKWTHPFILKCGQKPRRKITKHQKKIRGEEVWENKSTWESSRWALSSSTMGTQPSSSQVQAQSNSNYSTAQTSGSSVSPSSSSGSTSDQRAPNVKQITTKGAVAQINQKRERNLIAVFICRGLRASQPEPTSVSPSGSSSDCVSNHFIPSNSANFGACSTSKRKENVSGLLWPQCLPFMWEGAVFCNLEMACNPAKVFQTPDDHAGPTLSHADLHAISEVCQRKMPSWRQKEQGRKRCLRDAWESYFCIHEEELPLPKQWAWFTSPICKIFPV